MLRIKRIYEEPSSNDGFRVLVDRLWPRGVKKERAALNLWLKEIAPSNELRTWFGHRPERFEEFRKRYITELDANPAVQQLRDILKDHATVTILFAAHDLIMNQAVVLHDYLSQ